MRGLALKRLKEGIPAGFWVALVILLSVSLLSLRSIDGATDTLGWVEHTHQVLKRFDEVNSAYARSSSARRAFVVAGDESQLGDVPGLDAHLAELLAALVPLVADTPEQVRHLERYGDLVHERLHDLDALMARRRAEGSVNENAKGLTLTASIRTAREEIESEEQRLLAERYARTRSNFVGTKLSIGLGTLVGLFILLLAVGRLRSEIGRRARSEQALRSVNGFLDSIIENIPSMVFIKGADELRFERINRAGENLLGIRRATLVGKSDRDFFPAGQADAFQARDRETLQGGQLVDIPEEPIQTPEGERWLHTRKVPILDESGTAKHLLGISDDITEQRHAAKALKAAKDEAETANKELEAFSYSVAHDLRAPLRAIDGFGQALQEDCASQLDADGLGYLRRVRDATQRMADLIDGLLGLSRVTRTELVREKVDLTRLARERADRLREENPERTVEFVAQEGLSCEGDPRLLTSALENLLANAWKFTGKSTPARVEFGQVLEAGQPPAFFVRDNGAGFDPAYAHKLFGAFQRLHAATEYEGTGIGLATVQRIIRRHGGRIWADGEVGRGATFYFAL